MARAWALAIVAGLWLAARTPDAHAEIVWHRQACAAPRRMDIRVELDRVPLHRAVWSLCRVQRDDAIHPPQQEIVEFDARRMRRRLGLDPRSPLEGNLWEAGMEGSGIVLGVSLDDGKRVHLNTLLWIVVTKRQRHDLGNGLVVTTAPLP
ncbi:MAG: hypothetical protein ACOY82_20685 [Pseudomonadota bacterium]